MYITQGSEFRSAYKEIINPLFEPYGGKKIFSFCINFNDSRRESYVRCLKGNENHQDFENSIGWKNKYCIGALENINKFLKNTENDDYFKHRGVCFMIDEFILNLHIIMEDNTFLAKGRDSDGKTVYHTYRTYLLENKDKYSKRLNIYSIQSEREDFSGNHPRLGRYIKDSLASILRYLPMNWPFIDECHVRDAHSSLPNTTNNYNFDRTWLEEFMKSDKKYFMYTGVWYNPTHSRGLRSPFAATCCFRRFEGDYSCFGKNKKDFDELFDYKYIKDDFEGSEKYGVDEKMLLRVLWQMDNLKDYKNYRFTTNCFFVGISWILYQALGSYSALSNSLYNLHGEKEGYDELWNNRKKPQLKQKLEKYNYKNRLNRVTENPYKGLKNPDQYMIYMADNVLSPNNQFVDSRCIMKYLIKALKMEYYRKEYEQPTIKEKDYLDKNGLSIKTFYDDLAKYKGTDFRTISPSPDPENEKIDDRDRLFATLSQLSLNMIYPREHIWEYVFETSFFDEKNDIEEYIRNFSLNQPQDLSYDTICDININYRLEHTFDFSKYMEGDIRNTWILEP